MCLSYYIIFTRDLQFFPFIVRAGLAKPFYTDSLARGKFVTDIDLRRVVSEVVRHLASLC